MSVCSTGISGVRSGIASSVVVDQAYVQSLLPTALAWLYPYLPYMHGLQIGDVGAFCSVDPPTWTVPSGTDIYDFVTGNDLAHYNLVNQFIQDVTRAYLWYNLCECKSVATPAPPTPPSAPSNLPAVNPDGVVGTPPSSCGSESGSLTVHSGQNYNAITGVAFGGSGQPVQSDQIKLLPAGVKSVQFTTAYRVPTTGGFYDDAAAVPVFTFWNGVTEVHHYFTSNVPSGDIEVGPPMTLQSDVIAVPSGADSWDYEIRLDSDTMVVEASSTVQWFCDGGGNISNGARDCCTATDPLTQATLKSILDMVTLLQRQIAPFAYVSGTAHHSLAGTGTVAVQGLLGVLLNVSVPSRAGVVEGTPDTVYDCGWINFGTADGYGDRLFITSDSQVVFPRVGGTYTLIGYSLLPGVSMTLTELLRES
jgi:hypothetical protein